MKRMKLAAGDKIPKRRKKKTDNAIITKRSELTQRKGARTAWETVIKPNLDKLIELYSRGATKQQLQEMLHISRQTWYNCEAEHEEFYDALTRARINLCDDVRGAMYKSACGFKTQRKSLRGVPFINKHGHEEIRKVQFVEEIEVPPSVPAQIAFLKNVGGWSDNPVVDNALAENLSNQNDILAEMRLRLGMRDLTPRSTVADTAPDKLDVDIVSDDDLKRLGA